MASSNLDDNSPSKPLLPAKLTNYQTASESLTPTAYRIVKAFGYARIVVGAASLLAPHFTCGLFQLPISNETATIVRMFGVRDLAIGGLLVPSDEKTLLDGGRREIRRVLWANVVCDVADIGTFVFAVANGHMGQLPGALLVGGAALFAAIGLLGLKTV